MKKEKMITIKKKMLLLAVLFVIAITSIATIVIEEIYYAYKYGADLDELYTFDLISEDDVLLERLTPMSCKTSSQINDVYSCQNIIEENVLGWKSIDNCKDEWLTFTFDKEYYIEFMIFENFQLDSQFMKTDKFNKVTITIPDLNGGPVASVTKELYNNKDLQWIDLNRRGDEVTITIDSSYNNTTTVPCGMQTITFFGSESDNLNNG
jgi:hypothetical protein